MNNYINTSDIASYIGQNKWDYITPFERLWKRCDSNYNSIIEMSKKTQSINLDTIDKTKTQLQVELTENKITQEEFNERQLLLKETTNEIKTTVERIKATNTTHEERLSKVIDKEIIAKIKHNDITLEQKKELVRNVDVDVSLSLDVESFINKSHGTLTEDSAIKMYEKKYKVKLDTSQKFNKKLILEKSDAKWYVCGKVDGLYSSDTEEYIVEVKNRTKSFFSNVRDYEMTQMQIYMYMLDISETRLVERLNKRIKITDIYRDEEYIEKIIGSLFIFIEQFDKFKSDTTLKLEYILKTDSEKKEFINTFFYTCIYKYQDNLLRTQYSSS